MPLKAPAHAAPATCDRPSPYRAADAAL